LTTKEGFVGSELMMMGLSPASILAGSVAVGFVAFAYFILTLDRQRATSPSKDDNQVGLKLVLFALALFGVGTAAGGLHALLGSILGGLKEGSAAIKATLPPIIVGSVLVVVIVKALLPRTNAATQKQPERYFLGALAVTFGVFALVEVNALLTGLFNSFPWAANASALAGAIIGGAVLFVAISRFGSLSGWTMPVAPPAAPPAQYPPHGGGYPPQGGYPPGGGYPPQGGGGYPPQGGGGYPPPGGGGYPPR
jgi:hypothetical protein